jgi:hypothetical protein
MDSILWSFTSDNDNVNTPTSDSRLTNMVAASVSKVLWSMVQSPERCKVNVTKLDEFFNKPPG